MKKTNSVKVGDYEVVRRGSRIVVVYPSYVDKNVYKWDEAKGTCVLEDQVVPEEVELTLSLKQAEKALELQKELLGRTKRREEIVNQVDKLSNEIGELEEELDGIDDETEFKDHAVSATKSGLKFGCTFVSNKNLADIRKLL